MAAPIADDKKAVYNFLGRSGLRVANLALGTLTFGEEAGVGRPGQNTEEYAHKVLDRYVEWGGNFIDTANVYAVGKAEEIVGTWLQAKKDRERYVIASKARFNMDPTNPNQIGLGRRHLTWAIDDSLRRLQTDYIDLYFMHCWDQAVTVEETLRTMHDLMRCGKVRHMGASNMTGWQMQKLIAVADKLAIPPVIALQQQYSLLCRWSELEAFQVCKTEGVGVLPWGALGRGFLTGKFQRGEDPTKGRIGWMTQKEKETGNQVSLWAELKDDNKVWATLDACKRMAKAHEKTTSQVALRWLLQKDVVPSIVVGARTLEQLDENMGAANGWSLTDEEMKELDKLSEPPVFSPHDLSDRVNLIRFNPNMPDYHVRNK